MEDLEKIEEYEDTEKNKYLTFTLEKEIFAIEIKYVTEIIGMQPITRIPSVPNYIKGVINLRGKIITVMDMRAKFNKQEVTYNDRTCIIIIQKEEQEIGFIVDSILEVLVIKEEQIMELKLDGSKVSDSFIKGIGKLEESINLIVDCEKILE